MKKQTLDDFSEQDRLIVRGLEREKPDKQFEILKLLISKYPRCVNIRLNLALTYAVCNDMSESERLYKETQEMFPDEIGATAGLALLYFESGEIDRAYEYAQTALENGYNWQPLRSTFARILEQKGEQEEAAKAFLSAYECCPHDWACLDSYCRITGKPFHSPIDENVPLIITADQLDDMLTYIVERIKTPNDEGEELGGGDHTLRYVKEWAVKSNVELITLYQFLNAKGGFCDCEVIYNVDNDD